MYFQCTLCGISRPTWKDPAFEICKLHRHDIEEFLGDPFAENVGGKKETQTSSSEPISEENREKITLSEAKSSISPDNYEKMMPEKLDGLKKTIDSNFQKRSFAIEAGLSVKAQMMIEGATQVFPLIFMGNPSTYKSTILEIISSLPGCYLSDSFTPRSFVSHAANKSKAELTKVDLLPQIKAKTLITPELAPMFSGNPDQIQENFGILTRVLDGRGLQTNSGVHGQRGYQGDYSFTWLGAVIDIPHRVWRLLGNLGPKIYFLRLPQDERSDEEKQKDLKRELTENCYSDKLSRSKDAVQEFWNEVLKNPSLTEGKIKWDGSKDNEATLDIITQLADLLSSLRATVPTWNTYDSGGSNYNFEMPIKENPSRAATALYNLARGHAVLNGRNYIVKDDLRMVVPVALSSASRERVELFKLLISNGGSLNTREFMEKAQTSRDTALKEMSLLPIVGLADKQEESGVTKPITSIRLKEKFKWCLTPEFASYADQTGGSHTSNFSRLSTDKESKQETLLVEISMPND
jgi:hypothetical protein